MGIAAAASGVILVALAVGERAGLPGTLAWPIAFAFLALAAVATVLSARTAEERIFLGRILLVRPIAGGLLLGALTAAATFHLLRPATSSQLVSTGLGAIAGLIAAHTVARLRRSSPLLIGEAARGADGAPSLIQGVLIAGSGLALTLAALPAARDAVMLLTGWSAAAALAAVIAVPAAAIAAGGMRGLLALGATLALILAAGLSATILLGVVQMGALPLPGFTSTDTLLAIAGARTRLFQTDTLPFIVTWLPPEGFAGLVFSLPFAASAAMTALIARALSPGVAIGQGITFGAAAVGQALTLLGLAATAGYAVEAAGLQLVGASLQAPPSGLIEASRQGLAEFCGARPATLDELRAACGLAPRAVGTLGLDRIRLLEPFLWTGTSVSFGMPSALAAPARLGPIAFPCLAIAAGLWLMAQGIGRGVLGRGRIAPGLATHRLGLMRLAAGLSAAGIAIAVGWGAGAASIWQIATLLALLALGLDLLHQGSGEPAASPAESADDQRAPTSRSSAAPRKTAQSA
ncbi:MAG: hypothetical protein ACRCTI_10795 [Beijerinckiaceae bacterium]